MQQFCHHNLESRIVSHLGCLGRQRDRKVKVLISGTNVQHVFLTAPHHTTQHNTTPERRPRVTSRCSFCFLLTGVAAVGDGVRGVGAGAFPGGGCPDLLVQRHARRWKAGLGHGHRARNRHRRGTDSTDREQRHGSRYNIVSVSGGCCCFPRGLAHCRPPRDVCCFA